MIDVTTRPAGAVLNEDVCKALGISGFLTYHAVAPGSERASWYADDFRHLVQQAIDEANQRGPGDWRFGSTLREVTIYPDVSRNLGAADQVIDRLVERGARVSLHNRAVGPWGFLIIFDIGTPTERQFFEYGTTKAHAICLATLAAAGGAS